MNWDELKKRSDEMLSNPANFDKDMLAKIKGDMEKFVLENLGTSEAKEADVLVSELKNLLQIKDLQKQLINKEQETENEKIRILEIEATEAYYSSEWNKANVLLQQILEEDPSNNWAKEHLEKVKINQLATDLDQKIPREAKKLYRRARSLINARQTAEAAQLLEEAIIVAEKNSVSFSRAEELLDSMGQAILASEYKGNAQLAIREWTFPQALDYLHRALELDNTDDIIKILVSEIEIIINVQRDVRLLENADSCNSPLFNEILDKLISIKHPWLLEAVRNYQDVVDSVRKARSDYFEEQGKNHLSHAKEALYISVMAEASEKAIENFEKALKCNPQKIDASTLIIEAKAVKDKANSILNGDEKSLLEFIQEKHEPQETLINKITKRMEIVIEEFDKNSEEYKSLWKQLEGLFNKRTKSLTASEDHVAVVLAKVDAEIRNIRDRRPWNATLVSAILLIILSSVLLALNPKRTTVPFSTDFPADLILYASLFGSAIRVVVDLFDRSRTKWVDFIRLTVLRPLIGMGVTLLIVLFVYAGLGSIFSFSPTMGFWGYVSLSSIIGYSDSMMNKIIKVLEKGISIKV